MYVCMRRMIKFIPYMKYEIISLLIHSVRVNQQFIPHNIKIHCIKCICAHEKFSNMKWS